MWEVLQCEDEKSLEMNECKHKTYSARGTNWDDITWPKHAVSVWMLYLCMYNSLAATRKTFKRCNSYELSVINKRPETETLCTEKWESMFNEWKGKRWITDMRMRARRRKREREKKSDSIKGEQMKKADRVRECWPPVATVPEPVLSVGILSCSGSTCRPPRGTDQHCDRQEHEVKTKSYKDIN